jgi:hypothetical protein
LGDGAVKHLTTKSVRPELVEGQSFLLAQRSKKKRCFDKLSTNGEF